MPGSPSNPAANATQSSAICVAWAPPNWQRDAKLERELTRPGLTLFYARDDFETVALLCSDFAQHGPKSPRAMILMLVEPAMLTGLREALQALADRIPGLRLNFNFSAILWEQIEHYSAGHIDQELSPGLRPTFDALPDDDQPTAQLLEFHLLDLKAVDVRVLPAGLAMAAKGLDRPCQARGHDVVHGTFLQDLENALMREARVGPHQTDPDVFGHRS
jgi:hypothetical protein